mmetsp:Transcript_25351/g.30508  ORF Transcript_25351/g.30508 Transcript_25351/m.30508 type:complete len:412 (+) Transcript_25351:480-1715(+)
MLLMRKVILPKAVEKKSLLHSIKKQMNKKRIQKEKKKKDRISRDFSDEMLRAIMTAPIISDSVNRTVEVRNLNPDTDVWKLLGSCGELESVENGIDERGMPRATVIFKEILGAVLAVEQLSDVKNWRGGLRITLASGLTSAAARRKAGLPKLESTQTSVEHTQSSMPNGRHRGRLAYLKPGKFGFVKPQHCKNKEDNAFFSVSELLVPESTLALGDWLEYTPETFVDKASGEEKKKAKQVTKYHTINLDDRSHANLYSRIYDYSSMDHFSPPGERPDRLRGYRSIHQGIPQEDNIHHRKERIARGPDGTIGFTLFRGTSSLSVEANTFVPSYDPKTEQPSIPTPITVNSCQEGTVHQKKEEQDNEQAAEDHDSNVEARPTYTTKEEMRVFEKKEENASQRKGEREDTIQDF